MLKIGSFLILLTQVLYPFVMASVSTQKVVLGNSVTYTITVQSQNVEFPNISYIGPYVVRGTSSSTQTFFINGKKSVKISKTYSFIPTKDFVIPSFKVKENGKFVQTKPLQIYVIKSKNSLASNSISIQISLAKNSLYVFEHTIMTVLIKKSINFKVADIKLEMPNLNNLWIEQIGKESAKQIGNEIHYELKYLLSPQASGVIKIPPVGLNAGVEVPNNNTIFFGFSPQLQYTKHFSNSLTMNVKSIQQGISLVGDFTIRASVDKINVKSNEPVNVTFYIKGKGNFEDLKPLDIQMQNVSIYGDKPKKTSNTFLQKFAFIAGADYIIRPVEISFFNPSDKKVHTVKTKAIKIKVKPSSINIGALNNLKTPTSQSAITIKEVYSPIYNIYFFIGGFLLALLIILPICNMKRFSTKSYNFKKIFKYLTSKITLNDKELLNILLSSQKQTPEMLSYINQLENKIYKKAPLKINYKKLKRIITDIERANKFSKKRI